LLGDDRYCNNIFALDKTSASRNNKAGQFGLADYSKAKYPVWIASNIYFNGIKAYDSEIDGIENAVIDPEIILEERGKEVYLHINVDESLSKVKTRFVTTSLLGKAKMPGVPFENPDGSELKIDKDLLGSKRSETSPLVGPFESLKPGVQVIKIW
jgi:alpha-L-arabinofuranosidase